LALTGANTWLAQQPLPAEAEDGLLTAEDASGLNLLDTELVVLSAARRIPSYLPKSSVAV